MELLGQLLQDRQFKNALLGWPHGNCNSQQTHACSTHRVSQVLDLTESFSCLVFAFLANQSHGIRPAGVWFGILAI
jgi:hypothetical protein